MDRWNFAPRATAPGESNDTVNFRAIGNVTKKVDHSAVWRIEGYGVEAFFPVHGDFAFHSATLSRRLMTMSWTGWNEQGQEEPTEFSAGLINNNEYLRKFSLDAIVVDSVNKEAQRCGVGYQRRRLKVSGDNRRAELSYCPQLQSAAAQEIALHVYIDHPQVIYTAHWVKRVPLASSVNLEDPDFLERVDRMNRVEFCETAAITQNVNCKHMRELYAAGDRLYKALYRK